jgi:hypothetical protein
LNLLPLRQHSIAARLSGLEDRQIAEQMVARSRAARPNAQGVLVLHRHYHMHFRKNIRMQNAHKDFLTHASPVVQPTQPKRTRHRTSRMDRHADFIHDYAMRRVSSSNQLKFSIRALTRELNRRFFNPLQSSQKPILASTVYRYLARKNLIQLWR